MSITPGKLKALVKERAGGNAALAQVVVRGYFMERFLERLSRSPWRDRFVIKGGVLVADIAGRGSRTTMDIDATVRGFSLTSDSALAAVNEITGIECGDGIAFRVLHADPILEASEYEGLRVALVASLGQVRSPLKIDLSAGDAITPRPRIRLFKRMFEPGGIRLSAYPLETVIAEKLECILSRGTANTRMRDYYDVFILRTEPIDVGILARAFGNTVKRRRSSASLAGAESILEEVRRSSTMSRHWAVYSRKFDYATHIGWNSVVGAVSETVVKMQAGEKEEP